MGLFENGYVSDLIYKRQYLILVPVTMVIASQTTVSCASWREILFKKSRYGKTNGKPRNNKFGNGKTTAIGYRRRISSADLCKSLRRQSDHTDKYCISSNRITRRIIQGKGKLMRNKLYNYI